MIVLLIHIRVILSNTIELKRMWNGLTRTFVSLILMISFTWMLISASKRIRTRWMHAWMNKWKTLRRSKIPLSNTSVSVIIQTVYKSSSRFCLSSIQNTNKGLIYWSNKRYQNNKMIDQVFLVCNLTSTMIILRNKTLL